jgi:peptide deformylase
MPVRPVLALPHTVLQQPSLPVDKIDDDARALGVDLVDTMRVSPGCVGLAAPQIGVALRAFCIDVTGHKRAQTTHGLIVLFNPQIVEHQGHHLSREGCMSVPDLTGDVGRWEYLVVTGVTPDGEEVRIETDAFEARAVQHEVDHLDGLLFLDRVQAPSSVFPRKVYR